MSTERDRLKSKIMAPMEALVEQALAQGEKRLTLSHIEELALAAASRRAARSPRSASARRSSRR